MHTETDALAPVVISEKRLADSFPVGVSVGDWAIVFHLNAALMPPMDKHGDLILVMVLDLGGQALQEKHGETFPGMPFWLADLDIAQDVARFLSIERTLVRAVYASDDLGPGFRFQDVE